MLKQKFINYWYFVACNSLVSVVLGIVYFFPIPRGYHLSKPSEDDFLAIIYIISNHFSALILATFLFSLVIAPTILLNNKKRLFIQSIAFSIGCCILMYDIGVSYNFGIHIEDHSALSVIQNITDNIKNRSIPTMKLLVFFCFFLLLITEFWLLKWIESTLWFSKNKLGKKFLTCVLATFCFSQIIYSASNNIRKQQLLSYTQYLPYVFIEDKHLAKKISSSITISSTKKLQYPLQPLKTNLVDKPINILIIAMDAWRADCFNEKDSPNLWKFAQSGCIFYNHKAAANNTASSLFGLFYSIPTNYFKSCWQHQQSPLLADRLNELDYQISFFISSSDNNFLKNFFKVQDHLTIGYNGKSPADKDKNATVDWLKWFDNRDKAKPIFSFIFYDSLHKPDFPKNYAPNIPTASNKFKNYKHFAKNVGNETFIKSYKTSVHYIDSLANKILIKLAESGELDNTLVIITADHGCEHNDHKQGYWGYSSNLTDCQMQVPFAIVLPKKFQKKLELDKDDLTTHYDVVPTIMKNFLGITSDIHNYSIGIDLFGKKLVRHWSLAVSAGAGGGYHNYTAGIIEKGSSMHWFDSGRYWFTDDNNRTLINKQVNFKYLEQACEYMTKFFK